jgi:hypothetical protein
LLKARRINRKEGSMTLSVALRLGSVLWACGLCGCIADDMAWDEDVGGEENELLDPNSLNSNSLNSNSLNSNSLNSNSLNSNSLNSNSLSSIGTNAIFSNWFWAGTWADVTIKADFMKYLVRCALPVGTNISYGGFTWNGKLNLAPWWFWTWPIEDEVQIVSACIMAHLNNKGQKQILSMRSFEPGLLPTTPAEVAFMRNSTGRFFGNLWRTWSWIPYRFSCNEAPWLGDENAMLYVLGRSCEVDGCGALIYLGWCNDLDLRDNRVWVGDTGYRYIMTSESLHVGMEKSSWSSPDIGYGNVPVTNESIKVLQVINRGTAIEPWQIGGCPEDCSSGTCYSVCEGDQRLRFLYAHQAIEYIFRNSSNSGVPRTGLAGSIPTNEAFTVSIRYSNGSGSNIPMTLYVSGDGPAGSSTANLWRAVTANFQPTAGWDTFQNLEIYPVYLMDDPASPASIDKGYDSIRLWVQGRAGDAIIPDLDMVTVIPGPPAAYY